MSNPIFEIWVEREPKRGKKKKCWLRTFSKEDESFIDNPLSPDRIKEMIEALNEALEELIK